MLEVPMPDAPREEFAAWYDGQDGKPGNLTDFPPKQLADLTAGLNLVNLERCWRGPASRARSSTARRSSA